MATYTPNLHLKKPAGTDTVNIADINGNMDILDSAISGGGGSGGAYYIVDYDNWSSSKYFELRTKVSANVPIALKTDDISSPMVVTQAEVYTNEVNLYCIFEDIWMYKFIAKSSSITVGEIMEFQPKLIAGQNITIQNNVISATGGGSGGITVFNYENYNASMFTAMKTAIQNGSVIGIRFNNASQTTCIANVIDAGTTAIALQTDVMYSEEGEKGIYSCQFNSDGTCSQEFVEFGGGGSGGELFIITENTTASEIHSAITAGKRLIEQVDGTKEVVGYIDEYGESQYGFVRINAIVNSWNDSETGVVEHIYTSSGLDGSQTRYWQIKPTPDSIFYVTSAPTSANTDGLRIAVLNSEPTTKYNGWLYLIKE